ncbi:hypothetical protein [Deinococcus multiflagellatus]|uniref:Uncharacterized protein n=1 Tax=Deinococcus multiflagellatus TaxID=1656887 RepID=A0ABW1ZQ68_9DEIO|nr:hypothetical protein [Deinococcus multiflagellatus]MBZ9715597.1 hypothetical protein [Deinococcus multiflagellatus]
MTTPSPTIPSLIAQGSQALGTEIAEGAGGYRKGWELEALFNTVGGSSSLAGRSRATYAADEVDALNQAGQLDRLLTRLCDPRLYPTSPDQHERVREALNAILRPYGHELTMDATGLNATFGTVTPALPAASPAKPTAATLARPDFSKLVGPPTLIQLLEERWDEAVRLYNLPSPRFTIIALGALLEGALLAKAESNPPVAFQAKKAPKNKAGSNLPLGEWSFNDLIEVAAELGWIHPTRAAFSHVARHYRNYVHPNLEHKEVQGVDQAACDITWIAVKSAFDDLT